MICPCMSTYSNSRSTVLSYAAMFETLWNETELCEQIRQSHSKLEIANEQLERQYKNQRDFVKSHSNNTNVGDITSSISFLPLMAESAYLVHLIFP